MGFIEDFYHNRLDPQLRRAPQDGKAALRARELSAKEDELLEMLPETEKALFKEIREAWQDILMDDCLDRFAAGFRYGARFAYDAFAAGGAPYAGK